MVDQPQSPPKIEPMETAKGGPKPGTLAALVGIFAASVLFKAIPAEESGREVQATVDPNGTAHVVHVKGPQYLSAYRDIAGIPTACDGLTKGVKMGQRYTEDQCTAMLEQALAEHAKGVMACSSGLRQPGHDYQRAAAVSLAYNIGVAAFCGSTARKRFDLGNWRGGCDAFLSWNKARVNGTLRPVAGLTSRRLREREICMKGL